MPRCHAHRARAHVLLAGGEPVRAAEQALFAVAAGDSVAASAELEQAHRELAACGADGHRDEAARALRGLGRRVARPGRSPRADAVRGLSAREQEIAGLVADGLTNRQIAARLHLSPKTVEMHLTHAYDKLGIARLSALARILVDATVPRRPDA